MILAGGLPLTFVESLWWRDFCAAFDIHVFSRKTLGIVIKELTLENVVEPREKFIADVLTPVHIFVHGVRLLFVRKVWFGADGVTDNAGRGLESCTIGAATITEGSFGVKQQLVPNMTGTRRSCRQRAPTGYGLRRPAPGRSATGYGEGWDATGGRATVYGDEQCNPL